MITEEQARRLEEIDPRLLTTEQQCAYVLKCIEAQMHPSQILESRFKGDRFALDLVMAIVVNKRWAVRDSDSGRWRVNK